jgi:hypothetical protein
MSLLGVKRTWLVAAHMSAFNLKRTASSELHMSASSLDFSSLQKLHCTSSYTSDLAAQLGCAMDEHTSGTVLGFVAIILACTAVFVGAYGTELIGSLRP